MAWFVRCDLFVRRHGQAPVIAGWTAVVLFFGVCCEQVVAEPSGPADVERSDLSCAGKFGAAQRVTRAIDAVTIELANGTVVRLAGVIAADGLGADALSRLIEGRSVRVAAVADSPDRYGRIVGHVVLERLDQGRAAVSKNASASSAVPRAVGYSKTREPRPGQSPRWVQGQLVASGHAMVFATKDRQACVDELVAIEDDARAARLGLWRDAANAPRSARDVKGLMEELGRYRLVAGKVVRASTSKGRTYLNFGRNWRTDFTVLVPRELVRSAEPEKFEQLRGKRLLVRGWLAQNKGPLIVLEHASFIQVLE